MGRVAVIGRSLSSEAPRRWAMLRFPEMKGTLSYLPQRAPMGMEALSLFWHTAACKVSTPQNSGTRLFQGLAHGIIDRIQCNGWMKSRTIAFLGQSIFCRQQQAIHASIKPAHASLSTNGPPKFPRRFRVRSCVLDRRMKAGSKITGATTWRVF